MNHYELARNLLISAAKIVTTPNRRGEVMRQDKLFQLEFEKFFKKASDDKKTHHYTPYNDDRLGYSEESLIEKGYNLPEERDEFMESLKSYLDRKPIKSMEFDDQSAVTREDRRKREDRQKRMNKEYNDAYMKMVLEDPNSKVIVDYVPTPYRENNEYAVHDKPAYEESGFEYTNHIPEWPDRNDSIEDYDLLGDDEIAVEYLDDFTDHSTNTRVKRDESDNEFGDGRELFRRSSFILHGLAKIASQLVELNDEKGVLSVISVMNHVARKNASENHTDEMGVVWTNIGPTSFNPQVIKWQNKSGKILQVMKGYAPSSKPQKEPTVLEKTHEDVESQEPVADRGWAGKLYDALTPK